MYERMNKNFFIKNFTIYFSKAWTFGCKLRPNAILWACLYDPPLNRDEMRAGIILMY